ncbi:MAG TPA: hypothetical protein VMR45_03455 [Patescibacteria group bacterium]|nr:hypothetical protein [Patescibacteria group bacterium]
MLSGLHTSGHDQAARRVKRPFKAAPYTFGFTVIEVMIVLAVTGLLFVVSAALISGRQNKAEFDQSIHQIQAQIQQTINEVATGYYPNTGNLKCQASGGVVSISSGSGTGQGANAGCIFLGKAMQFKVGSTDPEQYNTFTIAGLQKGGAGGTESSSLSEAKPKVVAPSSSETNLPDSTVTDTMQGGLTTYKMWYNNGAGDKQIGIVAFTLSLANYGTNGAITSGSQEVDVVPIDDGNIDSALGVGKVAAVDGVNSKLQSSPVNPSNGVFVCFVSGTTDQSGLVTIGNNNRQLSVSLDIKSNKTCS